MRALTKWTLQFVLFVLRVRVQERISGDGGLVERSCLTLATPWSVAHQASLSMGFSRQEYWSGLPLPSSENLWESLKGSQDEKGKQHMKYS